MAILKIAQMGHPVLRQVAQPVDPKIIPTAAFQRFCDDLLETMDDYDGAGLAAPQVHMSLRVVVLTLASSRGPEFMINPVITPLTTELKGDTEGCLSVDGLRARVWRPNHIRVQFFDREGEERIYELRGFAAVVTQHECDHLDGVLFVDRCDTKTLAFLREYRRFGPLDAPPEADEAGDEGDGDGEDGDDGEAVGDDTSEIEDQSEQEVG